jgi:fatty aldehyde-generating acyl-ACP reductase
MDNKTSSLDFAIIGHQDSWLNITNFINDIRAKEQDMLSTEKIKDIYSFIPPRSIFKGNIKSKIGSEVNGVYIETFIDPDKLDPRFSKTNIGKVKSAINYSKKIAARIVTLGGFTSIFLEGKLESESEGLTKFTTGNTLTAAYVVKAVEKASLQLGINLQHSNVLIVGATGDIGIACARYLQNKTQKLLLCARNYYRLHKFSNELTEEGVLVNYSTNLSDLISDADVIISVASSSGIELNTCKNGVLICDAGYPKNLDATLEKNNKVHLFHGGMGFVINGFSFTPDYSNTIYRYAAPNVMHGCLLEAVVLAFENRYESYSSEKGLISTDKMEEIYSLSVKHGIELAPFYNSSGLW